MTRFVLAAAALAWLLPTAAIAQDADALSQRLDRLERDIQTLSKMVVRGPDSVAPREIQSVASGGDLPQNAVARIGVRLDALENDLRSVTGRLEEMTYNLDQLTQRLDRLVADVDFRLSGIEGRNRPGGQTAGQPPAQGLSGADQGGAGMPADVQLIGKPSGTLGTVDADLLKQNKVAPASGQKVAGGAAASGVQQAPAQQAAVSASAPAQPAVTLPAGSAEEQYNFAFGLLRKHQFDAAEVAFKEFLAKHKDGALSSNARYWLGETHYARAEYVKAAEVFLQGFEKDPKGGKAPDSLLKLAMSLGQLGQNKEACGAITKLFNDYPNASSSLKRTATRQQRQMECK